MKIYLISGGQYASMRGFLAALRSVGAETTLNRASSNWYVWTENNDPLIFDLIERIEHSGATITEFEVIK